MNHNVRIIKHNKAQMPKQTELDQVEQSSSQSAREIATTIKLWVSEFKERRRTDEQNTRITHRVILTSASQT